MHYIRLLCIFSYLCLWHFGNAAPFISIQSNSRSSSRQMIGGKLRTLYDFRTQHNANDRTGRMVHSRRTDLDSDYMNSVHLNKDGNRLIFIPQ